MEEWPATWPTCGPSPVARLAAAEGDALCPPRAHVYAALALTPLASVRVVLLGQDPYHTPGMATGLAFSVPPGAPRPPSLRNILAEVERDTGRLSQCQDGDLRPWAAQGVLLLNASLTTRAHVAGAHAAAWMPLMQRLLGVLLAQERPLIFLLWGRQAQRLLDVHAPIAPRHHCLRAAHPSPLSARRGFIGCGHFTAVNTLLAARGAPGIVW